MYTYMERRVVVWMIIVRHDLMQVPTKLASAAEYFFKMGVEGKRFRPTVRFINAKLRVLKPTI